MSINTKSLDPQLIQHVQKLDLQLRPHIYLQEQSDVEQR